MTATTVTRRNTQHPSLWGRTPHRTEDWFDEDQLQEMRAYFRPLHRLRLLDSAIGNVALTVLALLGFFNWAADLVDGWALSIVVILVALEIVTTPLDLPLKAYVALSYDKRHGLSNQTPALFAKDYVKSSLINVVMGTVMFVTLYAVIRELDSWWFLGWAAFMAIQIVLVFVYPVLIMPRFNKFTPLEEGPLRTRIEEVARTAGTQIEGIYTMDASKRSRRGNAFVAGFGKTKRVVLFDTILELPEESIANIVAHEIGHYRLNHTVISLPVVGALLFAALLLVDVALSSDTLLGWVDADHKGDPASLPIFMVAFALAWTVLGVAQAWFSRYRERAADLEALELLGNPTAFMGVWPGLVTLNKAELEPSWWGRLNASHPGAPERMEFGRRWAELNGVPAERPSRTRLEDPFASVRPTAPGDGSEGPTDEG